MSKTVLIPKGSIPGKGYLLTKNAAGDLVAIAPGANGTMLTPDSTTASGLAWTAVPSGGGGTGNMNYRGTWQPTTPYAVNDAYVAPSSAGASAGELFVVTTAHTSPSSFSTANATHVSDLLANDVRYRGTWAATTAYKQNDIVFQAGSLWAANADFTSSGSFNASNWTQISGGGGMANPMTAAGDMIVGGVAGAPTRVAKGPDGQVWTMVSGSPAWAAAAGGGSPAARPRPIALAPGFLYSILKSDGGNHGFLGTNMYARAFTAGRTTRITQMWTRVNVAGSAGKQVKIAVYADLNGLPSALVAESALGAADTTGMLPLTIAADVTLGTVYWSILKIHGAGATEPQFAGTSASADDGWTPIDQSNNNIGASLKADVGTATAAFPASFSPGDWFVADQGPFTGALAAA